MKDLMNIMKQAKAVQERMAGLQEDIAAIEAMGQAGGGVVQVTLSGKGEMKSVVVDPTLLKPDEKDIVEDLIVAAHNDAKTKLDAAIQQKTSEMTEGLQLPPGMKLPF